MLYVLGFVLIYSLKDALDIYMCVSVCVCDKRAGCNSFPSLPLVFWGIYYMNVCSVQIPRYFFPSTISFACLPGYICGEGEVMHFKSGCGALTAVVRLLVVVGVVGRALVVVVLVCGEGGTVKMKR